jgi:hypothetical protein
LSEVIERRAVVTFVSTMGNGRKLYYLYKVVS